MNVFTKWMCFQIKGDGLVEKHNSIWDKVSTDIKEFDKESVCNQEFMKIQTLIIICQQ